MRCEKGTLHFASSKSIGMGEPAQNDLGQRILRFLVIFLHAKGLYYLTIQLDSKAENRLLDETGNTVQ